MRSLHEFNTFKKSPQFTFGAPKLNAEPLREKMNYVYNKDKQQASKEQFGMQQNRYHSRFLAKNSSAQNKFSGMFERPRIALPPYISKSECLEKKIEQEKDYPLSAMIVDISYAMRDNKGSVLKHSGVYEANHSQVPILMIIGVNEKGETVGINIAGMFPYFFCDSSVLNRIDTVDYLSKKEKEEQQAFWCSVVFQKLEKCFSEEYEKSRKNNNFKGNHVHRVSIVKKSSIYGFNNKNRSIFKIELCNPYEIGKARRFIQNNRLLESVAYGGCVQTYESNLEYIVRLTVDNGMRGCGWIYSDIEKVSLFHYYKRKKTDKYPVYDSERQTICDIEYMVNINDVKTLDSSENPRWNRTAPMVIMSHDIEVKAARIGEFPTPDKAGCQIIDIGCLVSVFGQKEHHRLITFCLGSTDKPKTPKRNASKGDTLIPAPEVFSFDSETEMMMAWAQMQKDMQIDITTGYNTYGFDTDFLYSRAQYLGIFDEFSKKTTSIPSYRVQLKESGFTNRARGTNKFKLPTVVGNLMIDVYKAVQGDFFLKLRSYKLDNVAKKVLNRQKEDVHYTQINRYHEESDETRKKLVEYVNEDAILPLEILYKR